MGLIIYGSPEITFPRNYWCEAMEQNFKKTKTMSEEKEYRLIKDTGPYKIHHPVFPAVEAYCEDVPMYRIKGNPELFVEACHVEEVPQYYKLGQEFETTHALNGSSTRYKLMNVSPTEAMILRVDGLSRLGNEKYKINQYNEVSGVNLNGIGIDLYLKPIN